MGGPDCDVTSMPPLSSFEAAGLAAPTTAGHGVFAVTQLGIKEMDAYGHLWYGNHIKFFERATEICFGGGALTSVQHLMYMRPIEWGALKHSIQTYIVSRPAPGQAVVYLRWCVGDGADCVRAQCLAVVAVPPGDDNAVGTYPSGERLQQVSANGAREPTLERAVTTLQRAATSNLGTEERALGQLVCRRDAYSSMLDSSGRLLAVEAMDLFEQTRTEVVGGQSGLKAFKDQGRLLVVGRIDNLLFSDAALTLGRREIMCEVTLLREALDRSCFQFLQRLLRSDGTEMARVLVCMCCVNESSGALASVPDELWQAWMSRVRT